MKILFNGYTNKRPECSIADAIQGTIEEAGSDDGAIERANSRASQAAEILGQLIQALHENGNLRDEQVASMLGYKYKVEE